MDKLISVVVPTFDRKALTDRAIESVTPSHPELFEIVVVDDCGSVPYKYERNKTPSGVLVRTFRMSVNQGPGSARKLGVEKCTGEVVAFLDSDDVFEPAWPDALQAEVLRRGSTLRGELFIAGKALGGSLVHKICSMLLAHSPQWMASLFTRLLVIAFNPFYTPATAISKELCSFWTAGRYCEDYFTNAMAILKAKKVCILQTSACTISRSPGSLGGLSESQRKMWRGEFQVRKSLLRNSTIPLPYRLLVPLGMAYSLARNVLKIVKSSFTGSRQDHSNPTLPVDVRNSNADCIPSRNIAILGTRGIPASYGGFETFAEKLAIGLSGCGFDVTVFCESGESANVEEYQGVKLRYVSVIAPGPLRTIFFDLQCLWKARNEYDVVYMLGYGAAPFCLIPRLFGAEVWINPDGLEWARAKWGPGAKLYFRTMEWVSVRVANRMIADAKAIETSLASRHGELKSCSVIPYGCEAIETPPSIDLLSKWNLEAESYFLIVCRLEPENHVREILQAFNSSKSERKLVVVGNHLKCTEYVESLLAIDDPRIHMIGTIYDQTQLTSLRYHSFAYLHGHSVGGTNPSLLEAMGCGNFVIAHDNPFNRETLAQAGRFFKNAEDLTEMIDRVDRDPSMRRFYKEAARSRARDCYSWGEIVRRYTELMGD